MAIDIEKVNRVAKDMSENKNYTLPQLEKLYSEMLETQKKFLAKEIPPRKIIGTGYKAGQSRRIATEWLEQRLAEYKKAIEMRKEMLTTEPKPTTGRVKDYSYIKRSDISVLKATIDGKVLNVDPKKILSGTYVAGKVKPTASKLRVAKLDPSKLRDKILNYAKDFYATEYEEKLDPKFDKYIKVEDLKRFIECGLTEEMIMVFYCGWKSVMDIKADGEFLSGFAGGVFTFRLDEDGKYVKNWVKRGLYNCENNVYELGFKYPQFDWKKVGLKLSKTEIIETLEYEWFGKQRQNILKVETFKVKTNFTVIAVGSVGIKENGKIVESSAYGTPEERDPKNKLDLNSGYLALVSRNGKELFALAKKLLSQPKGYVKDFDWLVQNKTSGAEELKEANFKFANGGNINAEIDGLQKGDTITIEYGSSINKDNKVTLKVRSRNKVRKGTIDKITFDNTKNPSGVKFYAYNRGKGWSFAMGDMGISNVKIVSTYAEGGSIETITRLNGNRQEYTLPLPKISILTSEINNTALTWIEDNTGLKFRKTAWLTAYEAQPQKSEQIVKLLTMYGFVTQFHNNATNKNVLFLKFFKDEFMQYAKGGNLAQRGLHKATSTGDSIADWAFNFDPKKRYAKGGLMEHGLQVGDTIVGYGLGDDTIVVENYEGTHTVHLNTGKRRLSSIKKHSNGGGIEDVDFMAAARTSARDSIDWSEELRNFAGENYESLSELEKESIIADLKSNWDFQHSFAKGGNVKRTEINEDGSNIPEPLYEIFGEWDEDNDPYKEAERLRIKANEIGYDFDYDLSGAPTEFWKVQKANVGALLMAEKAKGLAPKSFDAADTKIANRLSKKSFAQRMSETGNEEYDRDAYSASQFAKGGYLGKSAEEVWNNWSIEQRKHFLEDHFLTNTDYSKDKKEQVRETKYLNWIDLPTLAQMEVERHVFMGQYAKGGNTKPTLNGVVQSGEKLNKRTDDYIDVVDLFGYDKNWKSYEPTTSELKTSQRLLDEDLKILNSLGVRYTVDEEDPNAKVVQIITIDKKTPATIEQLQKIVNVEKHSWFAKGGNVKVGDKVYPESLSGEWTVVSVGNKKSNKGKTFMGSDYYETIIENSKGERTTYPSNRFAKGGKLDETKYIPRDEIIKVELKNGKVIVNSWNNPIYSGLRIGKGISEREEMEEQGQLAIFKRGGTMPKYAQYVSQRDIAKVYLYDEDEPTEISGRDLVGGIYYDNEKAAKLIEMARKRGLIK